MQDPYADIRPYNDQEVRPVLSRLAGSAQLINALIHYRYPSMPRWLMALLRPLISHRLRRHIGRVEHVEDFQNMVARWVETLMTHSTDNVVVRGLEKLNKDHAYLLISNHRDIAMDPTLINYSLHQKGWPTSRIAIGDNLLRNPDIADIMRLNKSFIVKRSLANKREKLRELQRLSGYIRESLEAGQSVWIAQREGRAKDGIDKTDKAVLKMLALNGRQRDENFADTMAAMRPVPVSIQYEWDPCDAEKARELVIRSESGRYEQSGDEDTRSILQGLTGFKGRVFVDFGEPLSGDDIASAEAMAAAIDQQLLQLTEVLPVHQAAASLARGEACDAPELASAAAELRRRTEFLSPEQAQRLLQTYAVPAQGNSDL